MNNSANAKEMEKNFQKKGDDDDKIIFNSTKDRLRRLFLRKTSDSEIYNWAKQEGLKGDSDGYIKLGDQLILSRGKRRF